eukprot:TRINITY_DN2284_c0_g1_i5.p1 TRINITY_DN2284_c0_g1~~TRINITY_DN2284_c0_g1_i5.p1  ORF type:complete len:411 (+),score=44.90 TRINITY_DN2284_c0_g1_i5:339-1571(+)
MFLIAFLWCLPQALMSAELALMTKANGGNIVWVQKAFGNFVGFVSAYSSIVAIIINMSVAVVLFEQYLNTAAKLTPSMTWLAKSCFVFVVMLVNLKGVDFFSKIAVVLVVSCFIPFITEFIMLFIIKKHLFWQAIIKLPEKIQFGVLISNTVWAFGAFDMMGSLAGEVQGGQRTYTMGIIGSFPLMLLTYMLPILLNIIVYPNLTKWGEDSFTAIAFTFTGSLGIAMVVASSISCFGSINANMASASRQVWAMAKGKDEGLADHRYLPFFFSSSYGRKENPYIAIIFVAIVTFILTALPYTHLVQLYLILRLLVLYLEYAALIYLKWKEPSAPRPFEIPGGVLGAAAITFPSVVIGVTAMVTAEHIVLILGFSMVGGIVVLFPLKLLWVHLTHKYDCFRGPSLPLLQATN